MVRVGLLSYPESEVARLDLSRLESDGEVVVLTRDGREHRASGPAAVDLVMRLSPHLLEGRRLRWAPRAWAFHNLVAHPVMQLLSWCGMRGLGLRLHDASVPRPAGLRRR